MTATTPSTPARAAFRGIWPALLTPLDADLSIDHASFAAHCKTLLARGCPGVTPFGTTGEGPSFSMAERRQAIERLIGNGTRPGRSSSPPAAPRCLKRWN